MAVQVYNTPGVKMLSILLQVEGCYSKTIMYLRTHMCCITFLTPRCTFQITQVCMVPFAVNGQHVGKKR